MKNFIALLLVAVTTAFHTSNLPKVQKCPLSMVLVDKNVPGQLPPTGFFDPLGLSSTIDRKDFKRWRESELKHGRLAMMAALAIIAAESFPLPNALVSGPAIFHFAQVEKTLPNFWLIPIAFTGFFEAISIAKGWAPFEETKGGLGFLKEEYIPGDLGFDPLGLKPPGSEKFDAKTGRIEYSEDFIDMRNKELQNGRLAMLAVAGMVAQEEVDKMGILSHLFTFGLKRGG